MKTGKSLSHFLPTHLKNKLDHHCQQTMHALFLRCINSVTATAHRCSLLSGGGNHQKAENNSAADDFLDVNTSSVSRVFKMMI